MSDRESIRQTLIKLLYDELGEELGEVTDAMNLRDDLGMDSVDLVSVIAQVERRFRIRLSQQEIEALATVGSVLDLLQTKVGGDSAAA